MEVLPSATQERERESNEVARDRHAARSKVMGEREYAWRSHRRDRG
jgi:hypothetical protein